MRELNYGGQAVMEGVMMRGGRHWTVCARSPSGELVLYSEPLTSLVHRSRVLRWPFLRGLTVLWDSLGLGLRALMWSANVALGEDEDVSFVGPLAWGTVALSLALGVGLFVLLPTLLVGCLDQHITSLVLTNLAEGVIRLLLFVGYIAGIGLMPDIRRVFAYHGAEHKTINAYEDGAPLEPTAVAGYSRAHTRCGTGFLLLVLVIFVVVSTLIGRPPLLLRLVSRILLIPVVAGISYEFLKLIAEYYERSALVRLVAAPGLALQRLTTREPDLDMLEVGIGALQELLRCQGLPTQKGVEGKETPGEKETESQLGERKLSQDR